MKKRMAIMLWGMILVGLFTVLAGPTAPIEVVLCGPTAPIEYPE